MHLCTVVTYCRYAVLVRRHRRRRKVPGNMAEGALTRHATVVVALINVFAAYGQLSWNVLWRRDVGVIIL